MARIMVAHRSTLARQALAAALSREDDLDVAWQLSSPDEVLAAAARHVPDVVLLDSALLGSPADVGELCADLCVKVPTCRVLLVVDRQSCAGVLPTLTQWAPRVGVIANDDDLAGLVDGIRHLVRGDYVLDVRLAMAALKADPNPLTEREREVLRHAARGMPVKEIATALFLSPGTVRNYLSRAMTKTDSRTRIEAIRRAQEVNWI